jgi:repressor LexA
MKFNERLKELRISKKLTQGELARLTNLGRSAVGMYESGKREPNFETLEIFADFFNVDMNYLLGKSTVRNSIFKLKNIVPVEKRTVPVIGTIAAGTPILADEHIECYVPCEDGCNADFGLRVQGDSMINAEIYDGDIIFIRQQPDVDDGQIAAVRIDDSATLKRLYHINGGVMLQAENAEYAPMVFTAENCDDIQVIGLAVAKYSKIRH